MPPYLDHLLHNSFYGNYWVRVIFAVGFSYLMGSIPFRNVTAWFAYGLDQRIDSTLRGFVPIMNLVKTFVPVLIVTHGGGYAVGAAATLAAVFADCFCPWLRFRDGGRGAAASLGALSGFCWPAAIVFAIGWLTLAIASNYRAVGTLFATVLSLLPLWFVAGTPGAWCAAGLMIVVFGAHHDSFARLLEGTEPAMRPDRIGRGERATVPAAGRARRRAPAEALAAN